MGSFAATLFNFMLGWLQNLASGLWDLTKSQQTRDALAWLGEHWLTLVLLLAISGVVMDYLIWFIRWRPYYVWISWLRRLFGRGKAEPYIQPQADEPLPQPAEDWQEETLDWQAETQTYTPGEGAIPQQSYEQMAAYGEPVDYAAYQRPVPETEEPLQPLQEPEVAYEPETVYEPVHPGLTPDLLEEKMGWTSTPTTRRRRGRRSQRSNPQPLGWVRSGISQVAAKIDFIGRDQDEVDEYAYTPPPPAMDKHQAFHAPVYPKAWDEAEQQGDDK